MRIKSLRTSTTTCQIACLAVGLLAIGCAPKKAPPKPAPQPASADVVQSIRDSYFRAYPDSRVGVVTQALNHPNGYFVAVGELNGSDFREGDVVTFVDSRQHVLTTGTVALVLPTGVHVRTDKPQAGGREPVAGDVMIKLPVGATTL